MRRVKILVDGWVQGVGFRWWALRQASRLDLVGYAANLWDGEVEMVVQGPRERVELFVRIVLESPSTTGRPGRISSHLVSELEPDPALVKFHVR